VEGLPAREYGPHTDDPTIAFTRWGLNGASGRSSSGSFAVRGRSSQTQTDRFDATSKAHRSASGGKKGGSRKQAIGRSRGRAQHEDPRTPQMLKAVFLSLLLTGGPGARLPPCPAPLISSRQKPPPSFSATRLMTARR